MKKNGRLSRVLALARLRGRELPRLPEIRRHLIFAPTVRRAREYARAENLPSTRVVVVTRLEQVLGRRPESTVTHVLDRWFENPQVDEALHQWRETQRIYGSERAATEEKSDG